MKVFLTSRAFLILSLLWLSSIPLSAFFQNSTAKVKTKYEFTDPRISEADTLLKNRQYQEALEAYQRAYDTYEAESFYEGMVYAKERMGYAYRRGGNDSLSRASFHTAIELARDNLYANHQLLAKSYLNEGVREHRKDRFLSGSRFLDSATLVINRSDQYDSSLYGQIVDYKFYTYLYANLNADTLIKYLNERGRIFDNEKVSIDEQVNLFSDYSRAYYQSGDYQKAMAYALEGVRLGEQEIESLSPFYYSDALFNLGTSLNSLRELERALSVTDKLIEFTLKEEPSSVFLLGYYNLKAVVLNGMQKYSEAASEFRKIIEKMEERKQNTLFYRSSVMNLGVCYQLMGEFDKAKYYLFRALEKEREAQRTFSVSMSDRYEYIGQLYKSMGDFSKSLMYYDSALRSNIVGYRDSGLFEFPLEGDLNGTYEVLNILKNKQIGFNQLYQTTKKDSPELLITAIEYTERTHKYLMKNREKLEASKGKLFLSQNFKDLYENGIEAAYWIYKDHGYKSEFFTKAFSFFGFSKSILFLEQSGELGRLVDSRLTEELRDRYFSLKKEVEGLEEKFNQLIDEVADSDSLRMVNSLLMTKVTELKVLNDSVAHVLGDQSGNDLSNTQEFEALKQYASDGRAILEYFIGDDAIFVIGICGNKRVFEKIDLNGDFDTAFSETIAAISKKPSIENYNNELERYKKNAHLLYSLLLEKALGVFGSEVSSLSIIPDEQLSKLPFEILLSSPSKEALSYGNLDYVIKELTINYFLSSLEVIRETTKKRAKKALFGIGYSDGTTVEQRSEFGALPGTEKEIKYLQSNVAGDYFLGLEGTKSTFLTKAREYDVLHLAVHGQADSTNRYLSSLIFNGQEGILKTSDLYAAGLSARLAILSACESGVGQINKGEGTFSIARGFALVGVPSVVMSLWKVNDKVAADLMVDFHQRLQADKPVNLALRESKENFIKNSDKYTSHPYYWSAFVSLGEEVTIRKESNHTMLIVVISLLLVFSLVHFLSQKRKGVK